MQTLQQKINEAQTQWDKWARISQDNTLLKAKGKTQFEAICLVNYFEGKFDAYCDSRQFEKGVK